MVVDQSGVQVGRAETSEISPISTDRNISLEQAAVGPVASHIASVADIF